MDLSATGVTFSAKVCCVLGQGWAYILELVAFHIENICLFGMLHLLVFRFAGWIGSYATGYYMHDALGCFM